MRTVIILSLLSISAGCATAPTYWDSDGVALVADTIQWRPFGLNYKISGLVQNEAGERVKAEAVATECEQGYGSLSINPYTPGTPSTVLRTGPTRADQVFDGLCGYAMDEIFAHEDGLTEEQRQQRAAAARNVAKALLLQDAARARRNTN